MHLHGNIQVIICHQIQKFDYTRYVALNTIQELCFPAPFFFSNF